MSKTRALQIENELRFIQNRLTFGGLDLHDWVHLFDRKVKLITELQTITKEVDHGKES